LGSDFVAVPGWSDLGAAPLPSPLVEELELVLLPVLDFPQSQESLLELVSSLSVSSQPDDDELDDEELEDVELDEEEVVDDDDELDEELEEDELDVLDDDDDELEPQLSPLVSLLVGLSVPVEDVLPHPSSATVASSPVSS
jgi:hypothetical protein